MFLGFILTSQMPPSANLHLMLGILLLILLALLLFGGFKKKKTEAWEKWHIPTLMKIGSVMILPAVLIIYFHSTSLRKIPEKYTTGIAALKAENWDMAIEQLSFVYGLDSTYKGVKTYLELSKRKKEESVAKQLYGKAKSLLENAKSESKKGEFFVAVESTKVAIESLKRADVYSETATLLTEAEKFLGVVQNKQEKYEERQRKIQEERRRKQAEEARRRVSSSARKWFEGGTLHRATVKEWNRATYANKLATAADMAIILPQISRKVEISGHRARAK